MWCRPGDHWYCADGQSQFIVSSDKKQIWLTKRHENMQLRAKILGTNFKKKHIRFLPSNPKKNPPLPTMSTMFSERIICHTFFPGISERTGGIGESFARSGAGHEWQMISCPQNRWYLGALVALKVRPCTDRKRKCKKEWGGRWCGKFGRIACGLFFFG